jgi:c-di-GMP-binding flagellar brake protein YcgR
MSFWNRKSKTEAFERDAATRPPSDAHLLVHDDDVSRVLRAVCMSGANALLVSAEAGEHAQARFVSLGPDMLIFEIAGERADAVFRPMSQCCVAFNHEGRSRVFLATVHSQEEPRLGHGPTLRVRRPAQVATSGGRMTFRVPIFETSGLELELTTDDGRTVRPHPLDISYCGVLLELPAGPGPRVRPGQMLHLRIRLDDWVFETDALVRRSVQNRHALVFPTVFERVDAEPPEPLGRIVRTLETRWLQQRVA